MGFICGLSAVDASKKITYFDSLDFAPLSEGYLPPGLASCVTWNEVIDLWER